MYYISMAFTSWMSMCTWSQCWSHRLSILYCVVKPYLLTSNSLELPLFLENKIYREKIVFCGLYKYYTSLLWQNSYNTLLVVTTVKMIIVIHCVCKLLINIRGFMKSAVVMCDTYWNINIFILYRDTILGVEYMAGYTSVGAV